MFENGKVFEILKIHFFRLCLHYETVERLFYVQMKQKILMLLILLGQQSVAQTIVELDFPKLSKRDTARIYSFAGSRVDSFSVALDAKGKAQAVFPKEGYRGMAYLYIPEKGGGEMIIAEKRLRITCPDEQFNAGMLQFPESAENEFLRWIFQRRAFLLGQQEWLKSGEIYGNRDEKDNEQFADLFEALRQENESALKQWDDTVVGARLIAPLQTAPRPYAARFMELTLFMQRLYNTVRTPADTAGQRALQNEMEQKLDIDALYTSGNLWNDVHEYYPGLFVGANSDSVQAAYAASIGRTMRRLEEPVRTAFLSSAVAVSERTNRPMAKQILLRDFLMTYPNLLISDPKLKQMLGAYALNKGDKAPALIGLEKPLSQPAILIFFDSNCDHCRHELDYLNARYRELKSKGYRIVSIAADTDENNYRQAAARYAWDKADRLCDFKGFEGENFKNYGIIGTPTIFFIDRHGMITGRYVRLKDGTDK